MGVLARTQDMAILWYYDALEHWSERCECLRTIDPGDSIRSSHSL